MKLIKAEETGLGSHWVYASVNGFGASVIDYGYGSEEGKFELAVIRFIGEDGTYKIAYDTPITNDVLGWLTKNDVTELLSQIDHLPGQNDLVLRLFAETLEKGERK